MKDNADGRVNKYDRYELELFVRRLDAHTNCITVGTRAAYGGMLNLIKCEEFMGQSIECAYMMHRPENCTHVQRHNAQSHLPICSPDCYASSRLTWHNRSASSEPTHHPRLAVQ